jgi:putative transcriptional regulator
MMGEKKLKISDLASATNINRGTITRLYKETFTRVEVDVIEDLCKYFECGVADLFEYIDDKN